ncbi:aromatic amino acid transport family protein [Glaesserella parasuis]|uniref:aromatic amino acid transport family protein n=1 Tax=Glaesserella parasuis TaxID=738 RepID=UPI0003ABD0B5|nr:aromatic amino acid transport family protein [Glaesserella parasuis]EPZ99887.1 mtr tryptophan ArAAP transporter [Glaesserella parasuis SW114]MCT8823249.1 aromatic amino acid transporter [Glaesserella parasuis]MDD2172538.1 aromatic amino acid transporter [Glaesserella parasuis]MDG6856773.1 aromatic amino acid transporter [Glaesserella parasuis]MDP0273665.1 aromatic amino acid transporter [Glaesserella parasuis]
MQKQPSIFGGACIIASVCVGGGMLGLPSAGAGAWTVWTAVVMLITMIVMTISGAMLLEAYKNYDLRASFNTVTKDILGNKVNIISNISIYFVGGILLYAYITSLGYLFQDLLNITNQLSAIICVLAFGGLVWHSTRAVDRISIILIIFMVLSFIFSIWGLATNINFSYLFDTVNKEQNAYAQYTMMMLPIALTSFGYHHSVSSMRAYYGEEKRASKAIIYGTMIALVFYLIWIGCVFGNLPREKFTPVIQNEGNIDVLLNTLGNVINTPSIKQALNVFSIAAILSSFIGVGLGVFDFLADLFQFKNDKLGRTKSWFATFIPPLLLSLLFPFGFITAIGYAGAVATIWTCIIPALLIYKQRQKTRLYGFKAFGGTPMIWFIVLFGVFVAIFHILTMLKMLPIFIG